MVQRVLSFARYLPQHGFDVSVLSCWNPATPVYDPGLLRLVPSQVRRFHALTPEPPFYLRKKIWALFAGAKPAGPKTEAAPSPVKAFVRRQVQRMLSPDAQVLWTPFAIQRASAIIRKYSIDTVLVTVPPFSLFLVGNELKRRFPHIKLVSDFRDEWLRFMLDDFEFLSGSDTRRRAEAIERQTIESSDLVVGVTRASVAEIQSRYPEQPASKFARVPNGYDPALFETFERRPNTTGKLLITHNGTAYKTSSPSYYLKSLEALPSEIRDGIRTRFIGRIAETETHLFENPKADIEQLGFVPQTEALARMQDADYLLLTMTNDFSLPGTLFEYIATGIPVIALSPKGGEVDRLLQETQAGFCVPHDDPQAIQALLQQLVAGQSQPLRPDVDAVRRYERPRIAADFAKLLHTL
jgi:glycosyltransferase involved in cell wall biosynthesis